MYLYMCYPNGQVEELLNTNSYCMSTGIKIDLLVNPGKDDS
jgi:hypothetical protein